jgi:HD superfamily phosphohydrolase
VKKKSPIQEKLYRDPVHDIIAIDVSNERGRLLVKLIDTPEIQRLRRIRQLGLAYFAYQGAEHSRFAHVIGAAHLMHRVLRQLKKGYEISEEEIFFGQCAALLHDAGHGPFSHVFERFTNKHHEDWTRDIILSDESEVYSQLCSCDLQLPSILVKILHERNFKPGILTDLISSQLDVDRFDYLLRDSLMTGVKHGVFDLDRLIHVLRINTAKDRVVMSSKGLHPVEKYLQARYQMYRQVYQHKTVVVAEAMLTGLLGRLAELLEGRAPTNGRMPSGLKGMVLPRLLPRLLATRGDGLTAREYVQIDEPMMYCAIGELRQAPDPIARDFARRLLGRQLFKAIEVNADIAFRDAKRPRKRNGAWNFSKKTQACVDKARELVRSRGLDDQYYFLPIISKDTPYRPYDPAKDKSQKNIEIETPGGGYRDVAEVSPIIQALRLSDYNVIRFVFPETDPNGRDLRGPLDEIFKDLEAAEPEAFSADDLSLV